MLYRLQQDIKAFMQASGWQSVIPKLNIYEAMELQKIGVWTIMMHQILTASRLFP